MQGAATSDWQPGSSRTEKLPGKRDCVEQCSELRSVEVLAV